MIEGESTMARRVKRVLVFVWAWLAVFAAGGPTAGGAELKMTLKDAVEMGIVQNRDVIMEKYTHQAALKKVTEAKGIFDPTLVTALDMGESSIPIADILYPDGYYDDKSLRGEMLLKGKAITGADMSVGFTMDKYRTTAESITLSPRYTAKFELSLTQPLLRDFGPSVTKTRIRMAEQDTEATKWDVKDRVTRTVAAVEEAYWNYVYACESLHVYTAGLHLAGRLAKEAEIRVQAGDLAPVSLMEAQSALSSSEEDVIAAENERKKAELDLKLILSITDNGKEIVPLDLPAEGNAAPDAQASLAKAREMRADLRAAHYRVEQVKIEEQYRRNQRLPRLDLVAKYGTRGLAGEPNPALSTDRTIGTPFEGRTEARNAIDDLYADDTFDVWSVGVKLEVPFGNRAAQGKYQSVQWERRRMETEVKALDDLIGTEVQKAVYDVTTALKAMEAAKATVAFAQESLRAEERRFQAGDTTSYEVARFQRDLTDAKTRYLKAFIDYHKGWSRVRAAEGTSLEEYGIAFDDKVLETSVPAE